MARRAESLRQLVWPREQGLLRSDTKKCDNSPLLIWGSQANFRLNPPRHPLEWKDPPENRLSAETSAKGALLALQLEQAKWD